MKKESMFTNIAFWLGVVAMVVEFALGIPYFLSADSFEQDFGRIALMEGCFALVGLVFIDVINGNRFRIKPENFKKHDLNVIWRGAVILGVLYGTQILTYFIPMTISDPQMALAVVFASICEEIFFRGFIISLFVKAGERDRTKFNIPLSKKKISVIEIIGILISAIGFAGIHLNYSNNIGMLLALFLSGVLIGLLYWLWRDLTACIIGHFFLNFIWSIQMYGIWFFGMVNL